MSGGEGYYYFHTQPFAFTINLENLKRYVNDKYFDDRKTGQKFTELKRVASGKVAITKNSSGFWLREDNRYEQILVFACFQGETLICYVIARCISRFSCANTLAVYNAGTPGSGMEEKIVVVDCRDVRKLSFDNLTTDNQKTAFNDFVKTEARNKGKAVELMRNDILNPREGYRLFEFGTLNTDLYRSSRDPVDTYRVIILPGGEGLVKFFDDQAQQIQKGVQGYATQEVEFRKASTGNGAEGAAAIFSVLGP